MEVFYTAFFQASSGDSCQVWSILQYRYSCKSTDDKYLENFRCWASGFSVKSYTAINELLHSIFILHMVFGERGDALVKTFHWSFWLLAGIVLSWGKTESFVYPHGTNQFLKLFCFDKILLFEKSIATDSFWFKFCPCWKSPLLVIGHVFTVSIIRLLGELVGVPSLSLFPFGLFSPFCLANGTNSCNRICREKIESDV